MSHLYPERSELWNEFWWSTLFAWYVKPQEQDNVRKSVIFFTFVVPALHGHSKVSCLNFSTVYRDSWILTGKTWNNVCAPCKLKKKIKNVSSAIRMSSRLVVSNPDFRSRGLSSSPSQVLGKDPLLSKPRFFQSRSEIGIIKKFQETRGKARRLLVMDLHHIQEK